MYIGLAGFLMPGSHIYVRTCKNIGGTKKLILANRINHILANELA